MDATGSCVAPPGATSHDGYSADGHAIRCTLREAVDAIQRADIPYTLIGGLACALVGRQRCSGDIDVFVKPEHARPALAALRDAGFTTEETNVHWLFKAIKNDVLVDVLFKSSGDVYLDDEMLARARVRTYHDLELPVLPPEDLIVMKAIAHGEETPRHWHDALGVIAASGAEFDWEYLLRRARKGPRRVLSLLIYATANDLIVPESAIRRLFDALYDDASGRAEARRPAPPRLA